MSKLRKAGRITLSLTDTAAGSAPAGRVDVVKRARR
jgi:hypothetical protein